MLMEIKRGLIGSKAFAVYMSKTCTPSCPVFELCSEVSYVGEEIVSICQPHKKYIKDIYDAALDVAGTTFNTKEGIRIGTLILPMFSVLFSLHAEYTAITRVVYANAKGELKVHPVLAEIRKQTAAIENLWSAIGYSEKLVPPDGPNVGKNKGKGTGAYVDAMMGVGEDES